MKTSPSASILFSALLAVAAVTATGASKKAGEAPGVPADYPLTTCVVSEEKLDAEPYRYVHREAGKPDRVVLFCCDGCSDDFKKDPAKFLKKLDEAAAAKAKATGRGK